MDPNTANNHMKQLKDTFLITYDRNTAFNTHLQNLNGFDTHGSFVIIKTLSYY